MTTSTASITRAQDERSGSENIFLTNDFGDSPTFIKWGLESTKVPGDYIVALWAFRNMTPPIPVGATITSAVLRGKAEQSRNGVFTTRMSVRNPDGRWNPLSTPLGWNLTGLGSIKADVDAHVLSTAVATLADTGPVTGGGLGISLRAAVDKFTKVGQSVTLTAGGTLGFVDFNLNVLITAPPGNVWAEIYSIGGDGKAATLLATSDTRPTSAIIVGSYNDFRFTFSGAQQIALTLGQQVAVVIAGDFTPGTGTVWVNWGGAAVDPYAGGQAMFYGVGSGFGDQHYFLIRDLAEGIPNADGVIDWIAPTFVLGTEYSSGNFAAALQAFISGGYVEGDPICVQFGRDPATVDPWAQDERSFFSFLNAATPKTRLIVEWTAGVTGTAASTLVNDTSAGVGAHGVAGTSTSTLTNDTSAAVGAHGVAGTSTSTLTNDTSAAVGVHGVAGVCTSTLIDDTCAATGQWGNLADVWAYPGDAIDALTQGAALAVAAVVGTEAQASGLVTESVASNLTLTADASEN